MKGFNTAVICYG